MVTVYYALSACFCQLTLFYIFLNMMTQNDLNLKKKDFIIKGRILNYVKISAGFKYGVTPGLQQ